MPPSEGYSWRPILLVGIILILLGLILSVLWSSSVTRTPNESEQVSQTEVQWIHPIQRQVVESQPVRTGLVRTRPEGKSMSSSEIATYIYCYPLVLMNITRSYDLGRRQNKAFNVLIHEEKSSIDFEAIPAVNDAFLHSIAWVQLPFHIDMPATTDRYILYSLLDWFGNVIWRQSTPLEDPLRFTFEKAKYPNAVWFIARTFYNSSSPEDVEAAHAFIEQMQLEGEDTTFATSMSNLPNSVPLDVPPGVQMQQITPRAFYTLAKNTLAQIDLVPATGISQSLDTILAKPDVEIFTDPTLLCCPDKVFALQSTKTNGWTYSQHIGNFGDDYMLRAFMAKWLFAGNREEDTHYFFHFDLDPTESYQMLMDYFPPTKPLGFWTFSLYNQETDLLLHEAQRDMKSSIISGVLPVDQKSAVIILRKNPVSTLKGKILGVFRVYAPPEPIMQQGKMSWFPPPLNRLEIETQDQTKTIILQM